MADNKPIIIVKKKGGHGGHHGGAWKVAYADFVTAMMAFFMVMWLVNTAETTTKQNIASYFRKPGLFSHGSGTPLMIGEAGILQDAYVPNKKLKVGSEGGDRDEDAKNLPAKDEPQIEDNSAQEREKRKIKKKQKIKPPVKQQQALNAMQDAGDKSTGLKPEIGQSDAEGQATALTGQSLYEAQQELEDVAEQIKHELETSPELAKLLGIVDIRLDSDGLNIEIMDSANSSMFNSGSPVIRGEAKEAFLKIGQILAKLNNKVDVVGHTDAKPFNSRNNGYSNWELSSDRANSARRLLVESGVIEDRITRVVGRADKELRNEQDPLDAVNRRISLKIRYEKRKQKSFSGSQVLDLIGKDQMPVPEKFQAPQKTTASPEASPQVSNTVGLDNKTVKEISEAPSPTPEKKEPAHGYTPKQVFKAIENQDSGRIVIFDNSDKHENPTYMEKDKIFKESPIIGPPSNF